MLWIQIHIFLDYEQLFIDDARNSKSNFCKMFMVFIAPRSCKNNSTMESPYVSLPLPCIHSKCIDACIQCSSATLILSPSCSWSEDCLKLQSVSICDRLLKISRKLMNGNTIYWTLPMKIHQNSLLLPHSKTHNIYFSSVASIQRCHTAHFHLESTTVHDYVNTTNAKFYCG